MQLKAENSKEEAQYEAQTLKLKARRAAFKAQRELGFLSHRALGDHRENILKIFMKNPMSSLCTL